MIKEKIKENIGIIYLDKAKKLNALNYEMIDKIDKILKKWEEDENIKAILFDSKVEKGFSAGGDLKEIYKDATDFNLEEKDRFFKKEFALDKYVSNYKKPVISHWFGITMGGGIGLTINSDFIITDQTTNWAMPETKLGFVPDVGVGKYISKLPKALGQYVGLTGARLYPQDLVKNNIADILIKKENYKKVIEKLFELSKKYEGDKLLEEFKKEATKYQEKLEDSKNDEDKEKIEKYFSKDSLEEIIEELEKTNDEFAKQILENLKERCPFMLKVQFEKYFTCKKLSVEQTLDLDLKIINYAIENGSIQEGVRVQIIDKNDKAKWKYDSIYDVDDRKVKELLENC